MKIISYNVNGLRAAIKKGFMDWLSTHPADIICLQEVKALETEVDKDAIEKLGYHTYWFAAQKKGYSGVAVFTKLKPTAVFYGDNRQQSDFEGRVIRLDFDNKVLINAYFPSGTSGDERQNYKYQWLAEFAEITKSILQENKELIVCGDYNIAHEEIDIHNPKGNKNSSGFLPEERKWMSEFLAQNMVDTFRHCHKEPHHYTWWSQRFPKVRLENKGWRIDYICVSKSMEGQIKSAFVLPHEKHSDHCATGVDLENFF